MQTLEANVPAELQVHLILDNYGTHKTPAIQRWLASHPRFHPHFTPTSASWLNLVERWFALLTEKRIRRGSFATAKPVHLQPFGQLSNDGNGSTARPSLGVRHPSISDRTRNIDFAVPIVLPEKPLNLAVAQPHECGDGKSSGC